MRYILVPPPIDLLNTITDEPSGETFSFARSCRLAYMSIVGKGQVDATKVYDLRTKTDRADVSKYLELTDEEHKLLEDEFRRPNPQVCHMAWTLSAQSHIRAVLKAETELPAVLNGKTAEAAS